jgi:hypothetical protein
LLERRLGCNRLTHHLNVPRLPKKAHPLLELIPPSATGPLFLDPIITDLAEGLEVVQATPASFVGHEIRRLSVLRPPGSYLCSLAERDRGPWHDLDLALRLAHQAPGRGRLAAAHGRLPRGTGLAQPAHRRTRHPGRAQHAASEHHRARRLLDGSRCGQPR